MAKLPSYAELLRRYLKKHKKLVKPRQGWESLHEDLHLAYSMGRKRGYTDLGTYNGASRTPGGGKSDHAYWPAWAFDLGRARGGFWNSTWGRMMAWRLAKMYVKHHKALNVEYVIYRDRIWSRTKPYWHYYGPDTSHFWHIHVSGHRPGR